MYREKLDAYIDSKKEEMLERSDDTGADRQPER